MKALHTKSAPAAIGPYSQAIEVNGFVFASGQIPIDPATGGICRRRYQRADASGVDKCRPYHGGKPASTCRMWSRLRSFWQIWQILPL